MCMCGKSIIYSFLQVINIRLTDRVPDNVFDRGCNDEYGDAS